MSAALGRFTSPDPLGGMIKDPQTLNRYSYVRNNPIKLIDPTGMYICDGDLKCESEEWKDFEKRRQELLKSDNPDFVRAANAYGDPTKNNGVTVKFGDPGDGKTGAVTHDIESDSSKANGIRAKETVIIKSGMEGADLDAAIAHEGSHTADGQAFINSIDPIAGPDYSLNLTSFDTEMSAWGLSHAIFRMNNETKKYDCGPGQICRLGSGVNNPQNQIEEILSRPPYGVTPQSPGRRLYPQFVPPSSTTPQ